MTDTASAARRNRLGRGLAALIGEAAADEDAAAPAGTARPIPIERIRASRANPRKSFDEGQLAELAQSIGERGLIQPLVVRPLAGEPGTYEIVAGERRWRAAQLVPLHEVPAVVREVSDAEAVEIAIIENVQRADLNPLEEAEGYQRLMAEFDYTQEALSKVLGKSRSHLANTLRLINLPDKIKQYLADGLITAGHGRALVGVAGAERLAREVVQKGLSVRQTEALAKRDAADGRPGRRRKRGAATKNADTLALERDLADALGLTVAIDHRGAAGGELRLAYRTLEQLDDLCWRLLAPRDVNPRRLGEE